MKADRNEGPSDLELALKGDVEALEEVLGGIVAPIFDCALHLSESSPEARPLAGRALKAFVKEIRSGSSTSQDPLSAAIRHLRGLRLADPSTEVQDPLYSALRRLNPSERTALIFHVAADTDSRDLSFVLELSEPDAQKLLQTAKKRLGWDDAKLRDEFDRVAGQFPLPRGLIDEAIDPDP